ncbi:LysR family transcriptional regulator [Xenorhabdus cabanillasii]|uniref:LysR family transcriptional regulator n=1 Tax=Xenorhabdus cabanillasii TaxID=351673 RepID=A0A3D9U7T6_9GAMM|nr:transcriptional regulator CynR [Xenorhabdus cabanillasii]REF25542.1 LysR family transcriptional regulator [Xenorhabdus cabanillasii]
MNFRYVRYFLAVAEHHGFTRAAAALHVSQPALSQQVKLLEESLGIQLFDRSGRNTRLTDAGEVYLQYVRRAFQALDEGKRAIHDVEDLSRGSLRVAVTPTFITYFIGPLVAEFYARFPNITLQIQEISQERMEGLLINDDLDIGIAFDDGDSPEITSRVLLTEKLTLVVARHHPLAQQHHITLNELNDEKLILLSAEFATRAQIDRSFRQMGLHPQVQMEMNSISAVLEVIRRTSLSTLLPAAIAMQDKELVAIPLAGCQLERTAVLIQRKGAWETAAARVFIEVAQELADKTIKNRNT